MSHLTVQHRTTQKMASEGRRRQKRQAALWGMAAAHSFLLLQALTGSWARGFCMKLHFQTSIPAPAVWNPGPLPLTSPAFQREATCFPVKCNFSRVEGQFAFGEESRRPDRSCLQQPACDPEVECHDLGLQKYFSNV